MPGTDDDDDKDTAEDQELFQGADVILFRWLAARSNCLSLDRPDNMFTDKKICREMSCPRVGSSTRLRRLVRCLKCKPRLIRYYGYQA